MSAFFLSHWTSNIAANLLSIASSDMYPNEYSHIFSIDVSDCVTFGPAV